MTFTFLRRLVAAAMLAGSCAGASIELELAGEPVVKERLERGAVDRKERQGAIRNLFTEAGCSVEEQRINKDSGNVICTLPGETRSTIIVGGHFDFAERGQGIVDDWSGASLLPSLYQALKASPRKHTYVFVAFAGEERGLVGSSLYVKKLTAEQKSLARAFINLECLGLNPIKVWVRRSTPALVDRLIDTASAMQIPLGGVDIDKVGDDDTHPFVSAHIPVISIHSFTQETLPILHSVRDQVKAIQFDDYYKAYRLSAFYLAYLDVKTE